jgi:opacity protein-like surface antigen
MYKKIILASAILVSTVGVAAANPAPYVGASVGITNNFMNGDASATTFNFSNYRGVPFSILAGYGGVISQSFYLAGELTATLATAELTGNNGLKSSYGYNVSLLPGVMVNDSTLAFVRLGVARTQFTTVNKMRTGGLFGLGLQTSLMQNIDVRGEYDFVDYKSFNTTSGSSNFTVGPRADQVAMSVIYKMD